MNLVWFKDSGISQTLVYGLVFTVMLVALIIHLGIGFNNTVAHGNLTTIYIMTALSMLIVNVWKPGMFSCG